jgi:hypothetical protein
VSFVPKDASNEPISGTTGTPTLADEPGDVDDRP